MGSLGLYARGSSRRQLPDDSLVRSFALSPVHRRYMIARRLFTIALLTISASQGAQSQADTSKLPLKPARTISFTTDEGTWMSVDVSPDGRSIVFDLLGDLYTLPIEGGRAMRVTSGMPFDAQPRFSRDGRKIAFVSDRDGDMNVWTIKADGSEARQLTRQRADYVSPSWSADGRSILVSRDRGALLQIDLGTKRAIPVRADGLDGWEFGGIESTDGRYIYF